VTPGVKARARELRDWLTTAEKLRLLAGDWDLRGYFLGAPADPLVSAGDVKSLTLRTSGRMIVSGGGQGGYALSPISLLASPLPWPVRQARRKGLSPLPETDFRLGHSRIGLTFAYSAASDTLTQEQRGADGHGERIEWIGYGVDILQGAAAGATLADTPDGLVDPQTSSY